MEVSILKYRLAKELGQQARAVLDDLLEVQATFIFSTNHPVQWTTVNLSFWPHCLNIMQPQTLESLSLRFFVVSGSLIVYFLQIAAYIYP